MCTAVAIVLRMTNRPLRLYVASSWRNTLYPHVVRILRNEWDMP